MSSEICCCVKNGIGGRHRNFDIEVEAGRLDLEVTEKCEIANGRRAQLSWSLQSSEKNGRGGTQGKESITGRE